MCILVATVSTRQSLRSAARGDLLVPRTRVKFGNRAFAVAGPEAWNTLPVDIRSSDTVTAFKNSLKTYLFKTVILHHAVTIYLTLIGALVVTHAMLRCLTSRHCIIIIIIIIIIMIGAIFHPHSNCNPISTNTNLNPKPNPNHNHTPRMENSLELIQLSVPGCLAVTLVEVFLFLL